MPGRATTPIWPPEWRLDLPPPAKMDAYCLASMAWRLGVTMALKESLAGEKALPRRWSGVEAGGGLGRR